MALKFTEDFYVYGKPGTLLASANSTFNTQWITHGSNPALISEGFKGAKTKSNSISLDRTSSGTSQVERRFTTEDDTVIIGYAFRATARSATTLQIKNTEDEVVMDLEWPNQFQVGDNKGKATVLLNTPYYVELKLQKSTKQLTLHLNGYLQFTAQLEKDITDTLQVLWGYTESGEAANFKLADVYFADGSAGKYQDFLGPLHNRARENTEAIGEGWDPEPEDMERLEIMQTIPPVPTQYTQSDTVGTRDMYASSEEVEEDAEILAFSVTSLIAKTDIDDQYVAILINDGETDKLGADVSVPVQPAFEQQVFEQDVDGADWTPTTVQSIHHGLVIRPRKEDEEG